MVGYLIFFLYDWTKKIKESVDGMSFFYKKNQNIGYDLILDW